ncbi:alpha-amylase [Paraflavitalea sp. CAU 1676]|uniref:alpha-amylase n=1 Tax=Paraflavitalea sp. CAU 1676 TaxID=3032598 RepID=UPI0023DBFB58|nr:alpha-amylase [Paraflavitalea sp. CAU 1676]MDF2191221.1 alpha-amylase [Paraflavitalea sp. CAU 1676]
MQNGTMFQYFHWYTPADGSLWTQVVKEAEHLAQLGVNSVWLPPAYKGKEGANASGYDVYDLFDLGEFDQKGSVRTKYGTKEQLLEAVRALQSHGIQVYIDIVLNHKGGADETERMMVRRVDPEDRNQFTSEPFEIEAFTKFTFPGRQGKYSDFIWDHRCFTGVDFAYNLGETGIFSILNEYGEGWEDVIDTEKGNYDFLMFADIEFRNPAVREELKKWGAWLLQETGIDGVRIDAVKHISPAFYNEWLDHLRSIKPDLFAVGEYWAPGELTLLERYIEATGGRMSLFDASLHHNFYHASLQGKNFDLTTLFQNSLVASQPTLAVTVVDNHDTQPLQSLEAPVENWFKPHAYASILLREGGYPCIFYPDLYGAHYVDKGQDGMDHEIFLDKCAHIEQLLEARKRFSYGMQRDYFDHPNCVGWTREGHLDVEGSGCAVLLSNSEDGFKDMEMGAQHKGKVFIDFLGKHPAEVNINDDGWGQFPVPAGSIAVWVEKK